MIDYINLLLDKKQEISHHIHERTIALVSAIKEFIQYFDFNDIEESIELHFEFEDEYETSFSFSFLFKNKKQFNLKFKISPDYPNLIVGNWNLYDKTNLTRCRLKNKIGEGSFVAKSDSYATDIEKIKELIKAPLPPIEKKVKNNE